MLSDGVAATRVILHEVRKLKGKEPSEKLIEAIGKKLPHAAEKTLKNLAQRFVKIGGEILESFDAWEKENAKNPKN